MKTAVKGAFVISWSQTEVDGLDAAPLSALSAGAAWSWRGDAVRVDGPTSILRMDRAEGDAELRKSAARMVRRLVGAAMSGSRDPARIEIDHPLTDSSFVVTDGAQSFTVTLIEVGRDAQPLLMFVDAMPPRNIELWVVHQTLDLRPRSALDGQDGGVICFTPGTRIDTEHGPCPVEDLRMGDRVQTKDNGLQEILWTGSRRMTGARLFAMPRLRPVRIRAGALGSNTLGVRRPDEEFLVSPEHRMLVQGSVAQALFNTSEVLVPARSLIQSGHALVDLHVREVTYVHLLLARHQIVFANGVETESFHPANAALHSLAPGDRSRLLTQFPDLEFDPLSYGAFARRNLSESEAAILMHEAA